MTIQFSDLNLNPKILAALEAKGYTTPTPIQGKAIPHILQKKDFLGIAQTGTGKTAAFSLPIIHNLSENEVKVKPNSIRCLILTPTRELASQIADNIELYGKNLNLKHAVIFGGVSEKPQISSLHKGLDIVIATPGRLLDLITQGHVKFSQLEIFVLDEADRMLDMGFINDVKKIISKLPKERQTLFFSATMPEAISGLANSILTNPAKVEITPPATTVERIDQKIYFVEKSNKPALLKTLLKKDEVETVLVFLRTKHGANRLVDFLEKHGIKALAIHGNKSQGAREKALASFRDGSLKVLLATDIAARGIDVPGISHVVNYEIPSDPESYVHRIGRTARAGRDGIAISFCDPSEKEALRAVEKTIAYKIPVDSSHPYHGVEGVKGGDPTFGFGRKEGSSGRSNSAKSFVKKPRTQRDSTSGEGNFGERKPREKSSFGDKPAFGERKPRSFGDKPFGERKPRGNFGERGSFGDKSFGERKSRSAFGDSKPSYSDRQPREGGFEEKKPSFADRQPRGERNFNERGSFDKPFGDRKPRSFGDKPFGDRKPRRDFGERGSFGERRSPDERGSFGDRKPRGERPAFGDDTNRREDRNFGNRPTFGDRKPSGRSFGDKPFGERRSSGDRPAFGDRQPRSERTFGDKPFGERSSEGRSSQAGSGFGEYKKPYAKSNQAKFNARTKSSFGGKSGGARSGGKGASRGGFGGKKS